MITTTGRLRRKGGGGESASADAHLGVIGSDDEVGAGWRLPPAKRLSQTLGKLTAI
jgi:hypothetical protein